MSFPETLDPTRPLDTDIAAQGSAQFRALKQYLADVFGLAISPTQQTAAATAITAAGVVTISQAGATVIADPTTALGIATKQYVDNAFIRLYKTNQQSIGGATVTESALVLAAGSNQRWWLRVALFTDIPAGTGGALTIGISGPSGATYNLSALASGAAYGATPSITLPLSLNYYEVDIFAATSVTAGNITLTYTLTPSGHILSGSTLIATQVTGA